MHYAIPPGSSDWFLGLTLSTAFIALPPILLKKQAPEFQEKAGKTIGLALIAIILFQHVYLMRSSLWHFSTALPLHLCSLSVLISGIIYFKPNQLLFELLVFWGIPGAFHSLMTPEMTHGYTPFLFFEYYVAHAGIMATAVFMSSIHGFKIRKNSWLKIWLYTQPLLIFVGLMNYITGGNYMYLSEKPIVENPFVIGDWPWYIIGLELAGLLHFYLVYLLFGITKRIKN